MSLLDRVALRECPDGTRKNPSTSTYLYLSSVELSSRFYGGARSACRVLESVKVGT